MIHFDVDTDSGCSGELEYCEPCLHIHVRKLTDDGFPGDYKDDDYNDEGERPTGPEGEPYIQCNKCYERIVVTNVTSESFYS